MKPLRNNVLVQQEAESKSNTTESGIILTSSVNTGTKPGVVIAVGDGVEHVKVMDRVYLHWNKAMLVKHEGAESAIVSEDDVVAIL
jgi:co-chaperonin GroES (HSP10)